MNNRTVCCLDFDHTLFQTDEFFYVAVRQALASFQIDESLWQSTYDEVWSSGYSLTKHVEALNRASERPIDLQAMQQVIDKEFSDLSRFVFPDVIPFLKQAKVAGIGLVLLSFGAPDWQHYKVKATGLASYFDQILIATAEQRKGKELSVLEKFDRYLVVDNNPTELDTIKDMFPQAETYRINRVPVEDEIDPSLHPDLYREARRYLEKTSRHQHIDCRSLAEVQLTNADRGHSNA